MPTLSFLLTALLVSSGAMYAYLSSTSEIEKSKQKILESDKIVYIAKKSALEMSSVANLDTNQSSSIISLGDTKLSTYVAKDDTTSPSDMKLLDRLQKAMVKVVVESGVDNPSCSKLAETNLITVSECNSLKSKKFTFYGVKSDGIDIPEGSMIAKDSLLNSRLVDKIKSNQSNDKLAQKKIESHKKEIENTTRLVRAISSSSDSEYLGKLALRHLKTEEQTAFKTKISKAFSKSTINNKTISTVLTKYNEREDRVTKLEKAKEESLKKNKDDLEKSKKDIDTTIYDLGKKLENTKDKKSIIFYKKKLADYQSKLSKTKEKIKTTDSKINFSKFGGR